MIATSSPTSEYLTAPNRVVSAANGLDATLVREATAGPVCEALLADGP